MALLTYGARLRLLECARLRCQDVSFASNQIVVREGKGNKDRVTVLPVYGRIARLTWEPLFDMDAAFEPVIQGMKAKK